MHMNPMKAGVTLGAFIALVHIVWSALVGFGWAQGLVDFIFRVHMIRPAFTVAPFDASMAVTLVIVVAIVGYCFGYAFATIWNKAHKR